MKKYQKLTKTVTVEIPFFAEVASDIYHFTADTRAAIKEGSWDEPVRYIDEEACEKEEFGCTGVWLDAKLDAGIVIVAPGGSDVVNMLRRAADDIEAHNNGE